MSCNICYKKRNLVPLNLCKIKKMTNNKYFKITDTIYDICSTFSQTIDVFVANGFPQFADTKMLEQMGKKVTLEMALKMKKLNIEVFTNLLIEKIEQTKDSELKNEKIKIQGLLPCPVRVPLQNAFDEFVSNFKTDTEIIGEFKAASMGLDWIFEDNENPLDTSKFADIFISAGFDMFFDKKGMGKFRGQDVFKDVTGFEKLNENFDNNEISLKDPEGQYSMIGVVPAVFLVNTKELGNTKAPESWDDILQPEFENKVSLPVGDFDLFNSLLLHIFNKYGEKGVENLGRSMLCNMHPSQMVKSDKQKKMRPAVTIMPYFFTKMVREGGNMIAVWPKDGAIISPIFMLTKKESLPKSQPIIDFFASKKIGEILSHQGMFPSVHPSVDNRLKEENKFMWLGWDYIKNNDIGALVKKTEAIFKKVTESKLGSIK